MRARRCLVSGLLAAAAVLACSCMPLGSLPYFLMGQDPTDPPGMKKLAADDKDKEVKVAVLIYGGLETRPEFHTADRDLARRIVKKLGETAKTNRESLKVVSATKVDSFKSTHLNWRTMEKDEIGRALDADYVVYVEINQLSMYKKGSANLLYQGLAQLTVNLINVNNPDELEEPKDLTVTYPNETLDSVPVDDKAPAVFLAEFYDKIATQVAWQFTAHPTSDNFPLE
jgi:hypothetical protein